MAKKKKHIRAPRSYDPPGPIPKHHLVYVDDAELGLLGMTRKGPPVKYHGVAAFPSGSPQGSIGTAGGGFDGQGYGSNNSGGNLGGGGNVRTTSASLDPGDAIRSRQPSSANAATGASRYGGDGFDGSGFGSNNSGGNAPNSGAGASRPGSANAAIGTFAATTAARNAAQGVLSGVVNAAGRMSETAVSQAIKTGAGSTARSPDPGVLGVPGGVSGRSPPEVTGKAQSQALGDLSRSFSAIPTPVRNPLRDSSKFVPGGTLPSYGKLSYVDLPGPLNPAANALHNINISRLVEAQRLAGSPMTVYSGYRPKSEAEARAIEAKTGYNINTNAQAKGATQSQHLHGNAFDIGLKDLGSAEAIAALSGAGFNRVNVYPTGRIHVDEGGSRAPYSKGVPANTSLAMQTHIAGGFPSSQNVSQPGLMAMTGGASPTQTASLAPTLAAAPQSAPSGLLQPASARLASPPIPQRNPMRTNIPVPQPKPVAGAIAAQGIPTPQMAPGGFFPGEIDAAIRAGQQQAVDPAAAARRGLMPAAGPIANPPVPQAPRPPEANPMTSSTPATMVDYDRVIAALEQANARERGQSPPQLHPDRRQDLAARRLPSQPLVNTKSATAVEGPKLVYSPPRGPSAPNADMIARAYSEYARLNERRYDAPDLAFRALNQPADPSNLSGGPPTRSPYYSQGDMSEAETYAGSPSGLLDMTFDPRMGTDAIIDGLPPPGPVPDQVQNKSPTIPLPAAVPPPAQWSPSIEALRAMSEKWQTSAPPAHEIQQPGQVPGRPSQIADVQTPAQQKISEVITKGVQKGREVLDSNWWKATAKRNAENTSLASRFRGTNERQVLTAARNAARRAREFVQQASGQTQSPTTQSALVPMIFDPMIYRA